MNEYQKQKERARQEAIDWQIEASEQSYSYLQYALFNAHFEKLAKRYGLVKEFRENGII